MKISRLVSAFTGLCLMLVSCAGYVDPEENGGINGDGPDVPGNGSQDKVTSVFRQKMVAMQFTSVGCTNCPLLAEALKSVQENHPDRIIPVAFHMDYDIEDPMSLDVCRVFYDKVSFREDNVIGLPMLAFNFRQGTQHVVNEYAKIVSEMERQTEQYPVCSGVAVSSSYDEASRRLTVTARFISEVSQACRYHILLVEDGIAASQMGTETLEYVHDNVLRLVASDDVRGARLNSGEPLLPGREYEVTREFVLDGEWNEDAMRVVAVLLTADADGQTFGCNNANECAVGGSADYLYKDEENKESRFARNVCVMEFTGQWCSWCPEGAQILDFLVSDMYKDEVYALAFHNDDDLAIPAEADFRQRFEISDYPAYVTDMRDAGGLSGSGCRLSIEKSLYETRTHSGVAVSCEAVEGGYEVSARIFSEKDMEYRVAVYLVEDKVVAWQTVSGNVKDEDYVHRHVVRRMLSASVGGDALGTVASGTEMSRSYKFVHDPSWNVENLTVAVLAIDENGNVNNMAVCAADGGSTDYELKK